MSRRSTGRANDKDAPLEEGVRLTASNTHQRAGPSEQRLIPKVRELGCHLADRAVERGYHRLRFAFA